MRARVTDSQHAQAVPGPTSVLAMLVSLEMELTVLVRKVHLPILTDLLESSIQNYYLIRQSYKQYSSNQTMHKNLY